MTMTETYFAPCREVPVQQTVYSIPSSYRSRVVGCFVVDVPRQDFPWRYRKLIGVGLLLWSKVAPDFVEIITVAVAQRACGVQGRDSGAAGLCPVPVCRTKTTRAGPARPDCSLLEALRDNDESSCEPEGRTLAELAPRPGSMPLPFW